MSLTAAGIVEVALERGRHHARYTGGGGLLLETFVYDFRMPFDAATMLLNAQ